MTIGQHGLRRAACAALALGALAACQRPVDMDMRSLGTGFSTTDAALSALERPEPDARGVITYPTYQVAVAQRGDTVGTLAGRLGIPAQELASYNGLTPDSPLRDQEVVALPGRLPESPAAANPTGTLVASAAAAIDRAGPVTTTALAPVAAPIAPAATPAAPASSAEPIRHPVQRGETAYSIARLYGVPVRSIAELNNLGPDLMVREGQQLLVPSSTGAATAPTPVAQPGQGSPTPIPPSAAAPLPEDAPAPAAAEPPPPAPNQEVGAQQTQPSDARLAMPASGSIIRDYAPGRNEGIDIGAAAGSEVRAADAGTVAAITTNTEGVQIVVVKHAGDLLTVYTHVDNLTVAKGDSVARGQAIGKVRAGDPAFLHFEVRQGMASQDPTDFLP
ncbi:LysM peptidoglycan-binding domain-containing M23 family metallopeptidase [Rubellimicrobium aerolatum]|uniref:Peptidoglycan DD-metalloendopeptidase family protein n=1 Tax=Rubellimicrobium aerolatum TaxID=490979 RepID=A0ABW0SBN4_9RHOB|nr:LysM peptidoglycan-binding domain-containing M23 family metallopeptidase [Rubellimicrobium aerolatum]MBP1805907.1 murein DD-endopeptidase MepM/ murein hydrolase activator NlpD [Rubellimicrobium aerolatum]